LVPLDYGNLNLGHAYIPLVKIPAAPNSPAGPYKGVIITNPRGPGDSGILDLVGVDGFGSTYQSAIGTNYDIVSFDPRGVGIAFHLLFALQIRLLSILEERNSTSPF
jgi:hypothetical protein